MPICQVINKLSHHITTTICANAWSLMSSRFVDSLPTQYGTHRFSAVPADPRLGRPESNRSRRTRSAARARAETSLPSFWRLSVVDRVAIELVSFAALIAKAMDNDGADKTNVQGNATGTGTNQVQRSVMQHSMRPFRMGRRTLPWLITIAVSFCAIAPAGAALKVAAEAPDFHASAALGGEVHDFDLKAALAKGPVVLYFFPKSFTSGCTIEAHAFSDHIAEFGRYGATVIGVSADDIDTQKRFSAQECRSKFLVASDPGLKIARAYDTVLMGMFANRTSYVIAPDGKVIETYTNLEPLGHIDTALRALREAKEKL